MNHIRSLLCRIAVAIMLLSAPSGALAQLPAAPRPSAAEARAQEARAAWHAASAAATRGPADIALAGEAHLHLPAAMAFIPSAPAARLLRSWGNKVTRDPIGLLVGTQRSDAWAIVVRFVADGYIKDDDAKDWNADQLLSNIKAGNDDANFYRRSHGFPQIEIVGWIQPPSYDAATHRLVSSLAKRLKYAGADQVQGVNYDTFALGRNGYFSLDMLTDRTRVAHDRLATAAVLAALDYDPGHRYSDFNPSSDHVAAYGLAALIGAVAVKKPGLLALLGVPAILALFIYWPSPVLFLVAILAAPHVMKALRYDPNAPENRRYYAVPLNQKLEYGVMYLGLVGSLAVVAFDLHTTLETFR